MNDGSITFGGSWAAVLPNKEKQTYDGDHGEYRVSFGNTRDRDDFRNKTPLRKRPNE